MMTHFYQDLRIEEGEQPTNLGSEFNFYEREYNGDAYIFSKKIFAKNLHRAIEIYEDDEIWDNGILNEEDL